MAALDLAEMGLEIKAFTIRDISDSNGYLEALGKKRISEVKRDAQIAEAEAYRETKIKTSEATRLGEAAKLVSETQISEAVKEKELKVQAYRREQEAAKAIADLAYEIEANKVKKEVMETQMQIEIIRQQKEKELVETQMQVEIARKQKEIQLTETQMQVELLKKQRETELAEHEAERKERELAASVLKIADAEKYKQEKATDAIKYKQIQDAQAQAENIRLEGTARAEAKKLEGMAEVEIIRERGKAEAEAMLKKAEAFKQYNDAAITQMIIERLPEIAKYIAEPLSKTEKIVVIDSGSDGQKHGAAKVSGYVTDIMSTLPQTVEALTGIDVFDALAKHGKKEEP